MYPLEPDSGEHIARRLRIAAVQQQAGPALGEPLILERRHGIEPAFAFVYRCGAQGGKCLVLFDYHLRMKKNRWQLDRTVCLYSLMRIVLVNEPEPPRQRPSPVIATLRQSAQRSVGVAAPCQPRTLLKQPSVPLTGCCARSRPRKRIPQLRYSAMNRMPFQVSF